MTNQMEYLTRKEIENLYELLKKYPNENNFKLIFTSTGIGDAIEVWIKKSDKESIVINISDYENW